MPQNCTLLQYFSYIVIVFTLLLTDCYKHLYVSLQQQSEQFNSPSPPTGAVMVTLPPRGTYSNNIRPD